MQLGFGAQCRVKLPGQTSLGRLPYQRPQIATARPRRQLARSVPALGSASSPFLIKSLRPEAKLRAETRYLQQLLSTLQQKGDSKEKVKLLNVWEYFAALSLSLPIDLLSEACSGNENI